MTRPSPTRRTNRRRTLAAELEPLERRLARLEHEHDRIRNTLCGLAREADVTIGGACSDCDQAYVLIERGMMHCPKCRTRRAI